MNNNDKKIVEERFFDSYYDAAEWGQIFVMSSDECLSYSIFGNFDTLIK